VTKEKSIFFAHRLTEELSKAIEAVEEEFGDLDRAVEKITIDRKDGELGFRFKLKVEVDGLLELNVE